MEITHRFYYKDTDGSNYGIFYFIGGEMVTIWDDGSWSYEDALQPDAWRTGGWNPKNGHVDSEKSTPVAVQEAVNEYTEHFNQVHA